MNNNNNNNNNIHIKQSVYVCLVIMFGRLCLYEFGLCYAFVCTPLQKKNYTLVYNDSDMFFFIFISFRLYVFM
jgi:hypothetical protein